MTKAQKIEDDETSLGKDFGNFKDDFDKFKEDQDLLSEKVNAKFQTINDNTQELQDETDKIKLTIKQIEGKQAIYILLTRKYPLRGYILGVLTHTTAWELHWGGDETLKLVLVYVAWLLLS